MKIINGYQLNLHRTHRLDSVRLVSADLRTAVEGICAHLSAAQAKRLRVSMSKAVEGTDEIDSFRVNYFEGFNVTITRIDVVS